MSTSKRTLQESNGEPAASQQPNKKRKSTTARKDAAPTEVDPRKVNKDTRQQSDTGDDDDDERMVRLRKEEKRARKEARKEARKREEEKEAEVVEEKEEEEKKEENEEEENEEEENKEEENEEEEEVQDGVEAKGQSACSRVATNGEAAEVDAKAARKEEKRRVKEAKREAEKKAKKEARRAAKKEAKREKKEKEGRVVAEETNGEETKIKIKIDTDDADTRTATITSTTTESTTYVQADALSQLPQSDIDAFFAKESVTITDPNGTGSGPGALRPIIDFSHLPQTTLLSCDPFSAFKAPTPIQAASWPYTLSGRDVVGVAETGSGKTMAFALPCVEAIVRARAAAGRKQTKNKAAPATSIIIRAVVVSPTRELAMQTHEQMAGLASLVGLACVCVFGGASKDAQRAQLRRGADIVVATPGRLRDFMADGTVDLAATAFVVLDEADRMLDKGFEEDIKQIVGQMPARGIRQTLMFTATWPDSVQALAASFMVSPVKLTIGSASRETTSGAVELQANARITQTVEVVDPCRKEGRVLEIIRLRQRASRTDRILVFCLYKKEATRIKGFLAGKGIKVADIHGDLRQDQRTRSLEAFKSGQTPVLVATDVAARGLDIPEVKLVLNVTFPLTIEDYVHRIGRTGRAGKTGEAITLFTVQDKAHSGSLINVLRSANQPVPEKLLKFGTAVKKKEHPIYGAFYRERDPAAKTQAKITFDD